MAFTTGPSFHETIWKRLIGVLYPRMYLDGIAVDNVLSYFCRINAHWKHLSILGNDGWLRGGVKIFWVRQKHSFLFIIII
ncbi:hypothetical protein X798_01914 [Onchocerca flexuosa]|uniref:Uncharacterized protein n=2 Tax=Onchocerca flexuosa TaxID=387005 RepID=A0A183H165_9BILA|nr:hypothetical protein X798_01914 [Onchocerca flexuosa]VDO28743.1 unnamed protein product [Onchocerca flexuosa]